MSTQEPLDVDSMLRFEVARQCKMIMMITHMMTRMITHIMRATEDDPKMIMTITHMMFMMMTHMRWGGGWRGGCFFLFST